MELSGMLSTLLISGLIQTVQRGKTNKLPKVCRGGCGELMSYAGMWEAVIRLLLSLVRGITRLRCLHYW